FGHLPTSHPSCKEWNENVVRYLTELKPSVVITNSTRAAQDGKEEYVPQSYVDQWKTLADRDIPVIGIRDNPRFPFDPADCLARNKLNPLSCAKARSELLLPVDPAQPMVADSEKITLVDMTDFLCTSDTCVTVFNDFIMYSDREHISVIYAVYF